MDIRNELTMDAQDEREWQLSDEELDRSTPARACPVTVMCVICAK